MQPIWTLDARDSMFLEVASSYLKIPHQAMRRDIVGTHAQTIAALKSKGVDYGSLRSALVPQADKLEACFVFNSSEIESGFYGGEVGRQLITGLDRGFNSSILTGDLLFRDQDLGFQLLDRYLSLSRNVSVGHTSELFGVYLNNLTEAPFSLLEAHLAAHPAYVGHIDCTYSHPVKAWLSGVLGSTYLFNKGTAINGHEDDADPEGNWNLPGWGWENEGFRVVSVPATLSYDLFLAYKIERPVLPGFEADTHFSLNAISDTPRPLGDFEVRLDSAKLEYLKTKKLGSLKRAGINAYSEGELGALIKQKLNQNYIYNLRYSADHDVSLFNILLELTPVERMPVRLLVGLEYQPENAIVRLVTLF